MVNWIIVYPKDLKFLSLRPCIACFKPVRLDELDSDRVDASETIFLAL